MTRDFVSWAGRQIAGGVIGSTLLKALAQRVDENGGCTVTRNELVGATDYSEATVLKWLKALEKRRLIRTQVTARGRNRFWQIELLAGNEVKV